MNIETEIHKDKLIDKLPPFIDVNGERYTLYIRILDISKHKCEISYTYYDKYYHWDRTILCQKYKVGYRPILKNDTSDLIIEKDLIDTKHLNSTEHIIADMLKRITNISNPFSIDNNRLYQNTKYVLRKFYLDNIENDTSSDELEFAKQLEKLLIKFRKDKN